MLTRQPERIRDETQCRSDARMKKCKDKLHSEDSRRASRIQDLCGGIDPCLSLLACGGLLIETQALSLSGEFRPVEIPCALSPCVDTDDSVNRRRGIQATWSMENTSGRRSRRVTAESVTFSMRGHQSGSSSTAFFSQ